MKKDMSKWFLFCMCSVVAVLATSCVAPDVEHGRQQKVMIRNETSDPLTLQYASDRDQFLWFASYDLEELVLSPGREVEIILYFDEDETGALTATQGDISRTFHLWEYGGFFAVTLSKLQGD